MLRILILDDYQKAALTSADWSPLQDAQIDVLHETLADDRQRAERFGAYDVIVCMRERTPFSAALLTALPELRLLVTTGLRNASIDVQACAARGIAVCGAPGSKYSGGATTEVAWALILGLVKRIVSGYDALRAGRWQPSVTESLAGKTLGLVGFGKLGQQTAQVGLAFGMKVAAWSPNLTQERADELPGVTAVDKHTLFAASDVVSLHLVLSARSAGIVAAEDFAAMKKSAYFINTSRAGLVAPGALLAALRQGQLAGAGIDVFDREPAPANDPLLALPNVLASPHVGYVTDDNLRAFYASAVKAIVAWRAGTPVNLITP